MNPTTTPSPLLEYEPPPAAPAMGRMTLERDAADGSVIVVCPSRHPLGLARPLRWLYAILPAGIFVSLLLAGFSGQTVRRHFALFEVTASRYTFWGAGFVVALAVTDVAAVLYARAKRQRLVIHADATQLVARHESARTGEQEAHRWAREEIREIHAGSGGLHVTTINGKRHTIAVPARDLELAWLAETVREAMRVPFVAKTPA